MFNVGVRKEKLTRLDKSGGWSLREREREREENCSLLHFSSFFSHVTEEFLRGKRRERERERQPSKAICTLSTRNCVITGGEAEEESLLKTREEGKKESISTKFDFSLSFQLTFWRCGCEMVKQQQARSLF